LSASNIVHLCYWTALKQPVTGATSGVLVKRHRPVVAVAAAAAAADWERIDRRGLQTDTFSPAATMCIGLA